MSPDEKDAAPAVQQVVENEQKAPATLAKVEAIGVDAVTAIEQIFQRVTKGAAS